MNIVVNNVVKWHFDQVNLINDRRKMFWSVAIISPAVVMVTMWAARSASTHAVYWYVSCDSFSKHFTTSVDVINRL
jgi:hypothetical protein